jgi:hypothetical protein
VQWLCQKQSNDGGAYATFREASKASHTLTKLIYAPNVASSHQKKEQAMLGKTLITIGAISLSGCSLFQPAAKPSEITLVKAMQDVWTGLKVMKMAEGDVRTGLIASEVTVVFNIAASDKKTGNLTIDLSAPVAPGVGTAKAGGGLGSESGSQRGNTVTVKFVNLLTIPKETLAYKGSLADLLPFVSDQGESGKTPGASSGTSPNTPIKGPIIRPYSGRFELKSLSDIERRSLEGTPAPNQ